MLKNIIKISLIGLVIALSCQPATPPDTTNYYRITININPIGAGAVTLDPSSDSYVEGAEIKLIATPADNTEYFFKEWTGPNASDIVSGRIKMTGDKELTANFELYEPTIPDGVNVKDSAWDNATVYFVVTDRFSNGDASNDTSYGRESATNTAGHFYGGDLKGLTQKINSGYFTDLSIDAIWITSPVEQVHGWLPGGGTAFKHYGYHGYYAMDFTKLDANMGTEQELKSLVNSAHSKGIKIVFDVVMNHPGYGTTADLHEFGVEVLLYGWENATISNYHSFIDYKLDLDWTNWWGPKWIRAGLPGYTTGTGDLLMGLSDLPDFKTESTTTAIGLPVFYANKPDTSADVSDGNTVREYLVKWHTDWVEKYGIDGFRCDTAKHVELDSWKALKTAAMAKYNSWKAANPGKSVDNEDFWMTGEVFGQGVSDNDYYDNGFDSLINFGFQNAISVGLTDPVKIDDVYSVYADTINNTANFNSLSYISSHDTYLFFSEVSKGDIGKQKLAGSFLLLSPGAAQIYYGDEYGRTNGTYAVGTDTKQKTRSQMLFNGDAGWTSTNDEVLAHWKILSKFRKKHMCIGSGDHVKLSMINPYKFARIKDVDKVVCVIGATGTTEVNVSGIFADGDVLTDFYTGATATVAGGKATFTADSNGTILIEKN